METKSDKSQFAVSLANLLDNTNLFSRAEWAEALGTSIDKIAQWTNDTNIPRPHHLRMLLEILKQSSRIPLEPLQEFEELSKKPSTQTSPFGKRMLPTVHEYMNRPGFSPLSSELAKLSTSEQEKLLTRLYPQ